MTKRKASGAGGADGSNTRGPQNAPSFEEALNAGIRQATAQVDQQMQISIQHKIGLMRFWKRSAPPDVGVLRAQLEASALLDAELTGSILMMKNRLPADEWPQSCALLADLARPGLAVPGAMPSYMPPPPRPPLWP